MGFSEIAKATPFEGVPKINLPDVYGASPEKPFLLRIPTIGKRPISFAVSGLPEGLAFENGIISGMAKKEGDYTVNIIAENELGKDEKTVIFEIKENHILLTPLLGFTSWNAYASEVSQEKLEKIAEKLIDSGIADYGYSYINCDSGWQKEYGGKYDAIMPNEKFPDMKGMCDKIHSLGLKCGIYSTPMLRAWGCPKDSPYYYPGCTVGEPDDLFAITNTGVGVDRREKNNVAQWSEWGFDYLKYDWAPCDPTNAEYMRKELIKAPRDFGFCVTVNASHDYVTYWKKYCNSFRCNEDAICRWDNFKRVYRSYEPFIYDSNKGHFFDLDMLDVGDGVFSKNPDRLTEDEELCAYTLRAFMGSPIQISAALKNVSEFEMSMYCNEEMIAINQDCAFAPARPFYVSEVKDKCVHIFKKKLADGSVAYAVFNIGETWESLTIHLDDVCTVRDVWMKKDMPTLDHISFAVYPHNVKVFRTKKI